MVSNGNLVGKLHDLVRPTAGFNGCGGHDSVACSSAKSTQIDKQSDLIEVADICD